MTTLSDRRTLARVTRGRDRVMRDGVRTLRIALGTAALGAIVVISLRVASGGAADATFLVPSGRRSGYPGWMRGPLASHGSIISLRSFILLMAVMALAWLVTLLCAEALPRWAVPAAIVVATAIFTLGPPLLSSDVFNYIAYGRLGMHGINPYAHGPAALMSDPVYPYTGHLWKHDPSAYGPLFTGVTQVLAPLGTAASYWALRVLTGVAALACAALVWLTARRLGRPPALAAAFFALNPLVLVWAIGGAHNDVLTVALVALAVYLAVRGAAASAGATLAGAVAIKVSAGLVLPFLLLGARPRRRAAAGFAAAAAVVVAGSLLVYGTAMRSMVRVLASEQHFHWIVVSAPAFVGHYLGLGRLTNHDRHILLAVFTAAVAALIVVAFRGGGRRWLEAAGAATLVLLVTTGWLLPWYIIWVLPLAAVLRMRAVPAAAVVLTLLLLVMQLDHFWLTRNSHHHHLRHRQHIALRVSGRP